MANFFSSCADNFLSNFFFEIFLWQIFHVSKTAMANFFPKIPYSGTVLKSRLDGPPLWQKNNHHTIQWYSVKITLGWPSIVKIPYSGTVLKSRLDGQCTCDAVVFSTAGRQKVLGSIPMCDEMSWHIFCQHQTIFVTKVFLRIFLWQIFFC